MLTQMIFFWVISHPLVTYVGFIDEKRTRLGLSEPMLSGHVGPVATQQNIDINMRLAQNRLHPKYPNAMVYRCLSSCSKNWNGHFSGVPQFQTTWCVASGDGFFSLPAKLLSGERPQAITQGWKGRLFVEDPVGIHTLKWNIEPRKRPESTMTKQVIPPN